MRRTVLALVVAASIPVLASANVVRFDIEKREDILDGKSFGLAGAYEKIVGRVHFAIDPTLAPNGIVTDLAKAERNSDGNVEYSAEFYIIKPKNTTKGNGSLLLEVGNRGGKGLLSFFNLARGNYDPESPEHFGDGFLMRHGMTLLWVGWQWDTPEVEGRMRMYPPKATDNGKPLRGIVRSDFVPA